MIEKLNKLLSLTEEIAKLEREIEQSLGCDKFMFVVHTHFSDGKIRVGVCIRDNFNDNVAFFRLDGSVWTLQGSGDYVDSVDEILGILNGAMS